jgi:hypothetical protein
MMSSLQDQVKVESSSNPASLFDEIKLLGEIQSKNEEA